MKFVLNQEEREAIARLFSSNDYKVFKKYLDQELSNLRNILSVNFQESEFYIAAQVIGRKQVTEAIEALISTLQQNAIETRTKKVLKDRTNE